MKRYVLQKRMDENGESLKAGRGVMMLSVAQGGNDRGLEEAEGRQGIASEVEWLTFKEKGRGGPGQKGNVHL